MCLYVCARVRVCAVSTTLSVLPPPAVQCQQMTVSGKHLTVLKGKRKTHLTQQTHTSPPPVGSSVYGVSLSLSLSLSLSHFSPMKVHTVSNNDQQNHVF